MRRVTDKGLLLRRRVCVAAQDGSAGRALRSRESCVCIYIYIYVYIYLRGRWRSLVPGRGADHHGLLRRGRHLHARRGRLEGLAADRPPDAYAPLLHPVLLRLWSLLRHGGVVLRHAPHQRGVDPLHARLLVPELHGPEGLEGLHGQRHSPGAHILPLPHPLHPVQLLPVRPAGPQRHINGVVRAVFKNSNLFSRPRPWQFEIRDSTDTQATHLLLGFETLNLNFCDLKL